jgi:hypothetical protein
MKIAIRPHFSFFDIQRRSIDGTEIYDVADLDNARGELHLHFKSESIINDNAPILINLVELLDFLYRTETSSSSECLFLDMSPRLFSKSVGDLIELSWLDPSRVILSDDDIIETFSPLEFRQTLSEAEATAASILTRVSPDLRDYLRLLARPQAQSDSN